MLGQGLGKAVSSRYECNRSRRHQAKKSTDPVSDMPFVPKLLPIPSCKPQPACFRGAHSVFVASNDASSGTNIIPSSPEAEATEQLPEKKRAQPVKSGWPCFRISTFFFQRKDPHVSSFQTGTCLLAPRALGMISIEPLWNRSPGGFLAQLPAAPFPSIEPPALEAVQGSTRVGQNSQGRFVIFI